MYARTLPSQIVSIAVVRREAFHIDWVEVDPYYDAADWHAAARGDGHCYGGAVAYVRRGSGTLKNALRRAEELAAIVNAADNAAFFADGWHDHPLTAGPS